MHNNQLSPFYAGTSGLVLPVPNKSFFPIEFQDKSRLNFYASLFNSLEVNSSFYKIPMASTVKKWADETPADFKFTYKLWQGITHNKAFVFNVADIERFMQTIFNADQKSGCLLIQLPPSAAIANAAQLEKLLTEIGKLNSPQQWKVAVEFRNKTWYQQTTYDMPSSAISELPFETDTIYIRFHGIKGDYKGGYINDFLDEYAGYINEWRQAGKTVYAYFNNTIGDAVKNLATLNGFVNERSGKVSTIKLVG
jgi:uncharacterized protein YecE (DUF72 family)